VLLVRAVGGSEMQREKYVREILMSEGVISGLGGVDKNGLKSAFLETSDPCFKGFLLLGSCVIIPIDFPPP